MASERARDLVVIVMEELADVVEMKGTMGEHWAAFDRLADIFDLEFQDEE